MDVHVLVKSYRVLPKACMVMWCCAVPTLNNLQHVIAKAQMCMHVQKTYHHHKLTLWCPAKVALGVSTVQLRGKLKDSRE